MIGEIVALARNRIPLNATAARGLMLLKQEQSNAE